MMPGWVIWLFGFTWLRWENAAELAIAYAVIGWIVFRIFRWLGRKEPTGHGKNINYIMAVLTGCAWPLAIPGWCLLSLVLVCCQLRDRWKKGHVT